MAKDENKRIIGRASIPYVFGLLLLNLSTTLGMGVGGDATIYITSARNLLAGNGLGLINPDGVFRLIPYFPPFYPLTLALFGLSGIDITVIAKFLNVLFFVFTIFAVSSWVAEVSRSALNGFMAGLLIALSPVLIPAYSWAMSEPLCILCGTLGLILLERYLARGKAIHLWGSAILCGLSFLTRYSAAAYLGAGVVMLLFFRRSALKTRLADAVRFGLAAVLPMAVWMVYDVLKTDTLASRSMLQGRNLLTELTRFSDQLKPILLQWVVPDSWIDTPPYPVFFNDLLIFVIIAFILGSLAAACLRFARMKDSAKEIVESRELELLSTRLSNMTILLTGFILAYTLVILIVSLTTYPPITIGARMFTPVHVAFLWLLAILFVRIWQGNRRVLKGIALAVFMGFAGFYGLRSWRIARQNAMDGLGYNSYHWQHSEIVAWLREHIDSGQQLVTNEETALLYLLDRSSWPMQEVYVSEPDKDFYAYENGTPAANDEGRTVFQNGEALLVVFDSFEDQMRDIYGADTEKRIEALFKNLTIIIDGDDGIIYSLK